MSRKGLSKKLRFSVFERDGFTCRYCGRTPPDVLLVVDHILPVVGGGVNDVSNLVTACAECNSGKGARKLGDLPQSTDLCRAQELLEQADIAKLTVRVAKLEMKARQEIVEAFCQIFGVTSAYTRDISCIVNLTKEFGPVEVLNWLHKASARGITASNSIQYVCGIARNVREDRS